MGVGALGYLGVSIESRNGVGTTSSTSDYICDFIGFNSENLSVTRDDIISQSIEAQWDEDAAYNGQQRVQGGISVDIHPGTIGYLLRTVFDTSTTEINSNYTLAQSLATGTTSHEFIRVHRFVTGQTQFHAGSGSDLPTNTFAIYRGPAIGVGSAYLYQNVAGASMELSIEAGGLARATFEFLGRDYDQRAKHTPTYKPARAFVWSQCSLQIETGGVPGGTSIYESFTVRLDNQLEAVPKLDGRLRPDLIKRNGFRQVTVSGRLSFQNDSEYYRFLSGSETRMFMVFRGDRTISTSTHVEAMWWDIPKMRYSTFPLGIGGPGRISIDFTGRGMLDQASLYSLQVILVNTRQNTYNANTNA